MVDPATFRDVLAQWPSGVTVVTTLRRRRVARHDRELVLQCQPGPAAGVGLPDRDALHPRADRRERRLRDQRPRQGPDRGRPPLRRHGARLADRFEGEDWTTAETGVPLLDSALGWLDCRVVHAYAGGDHTIFVGEVVAGARRPPLRAAALPLARLGPVRRRAARRGRRSPTPASSPALRGAGAPGGRRTIARERRRAGVRVRVARPDRADEPSRPAHGPQPLALDARQRAWSPTGARRERALDAGVGTVEIAARPRPTRRDLDQRARASSTASPTASPSARRTRSPPSAPTPSCRRRARSPARGVLEICAARQRRRGHPARRSAPSSRRPSRSPARSPLRVRLARP